jgi:hypothetical protein
MKRVVTRGALVVLGLVAAAATFAAIKIGPANIIGLIRYDQREEGTLEVGDKLPDVTLVSLDGATKPRVHDRIGGKPLVLIFGSFT